MLRSPAGFPLTSVMLTHDDTPTTRLAQAHTTKLNYSHYSHPHASHARITGSHERSSARANETRRVNVRSTVIAATSKRQRHRSALVARPPYALLASGNRSKPPTKRKSIILLQVEKIIVRNIAVLVQVEATHQGDKRLIVKIHIVGGKRILQHLIADES